jgi:2,4-diketo-3-deoxy-L-fuconate hydrolase
MITVSGHSRWSAAVNGSRARVVTPSRLSDPSWATTDEIKDPHHLRLWLTVNGTTMQDSNTSDLIFRIPFILSDVSQFMTLVPGDVISTGTPEGVGFGLKPPRYLKHGDLVEFGIEGLGTARQRAVTYEERGKTIA